jgi:zinc protease
MGRFSSSAGRRAATLAAFTFALAAPQSSALAQAASPPIPPLGYTRFVLSNGLVALLNEDHASPLVVVDVWYHIGSKDDKPGRTGMSHFCEHLMSQGSPHIDQPYSTFYRSIGGTSPRFALTTEDITHYYIVLPSNQLETALWAESDRMAAPLSRADSARLVAVRGVISQERQTEIENIPFAVYRELTVAELFPAGHPYHNAALPPLVDLYGATPDDLKQACGPYYVPNNAVISLSGDFSTPRARAWIEKYFGGIHRGPPAPRTQVPVVKLAGEQRVALEDRRAQQPELHFDWIGAPFSSPDRLALNALGSALSLNRFGRLSKLLIYDRQLAVRVSADNYDLEQSGIFEIVVTPRPGASMTTIETLVDSVLAALPTSPITPQEIGRYNSFNTTLAVASLQTHMARADTLAHGEVFAGDPVAYAKQVNAARTLTPSAVQRVTQQYLGAGRVVMSLVPAGKLELISKPDLPFRNITPSPRARTQP